MVKFYSQWVLACSVILSTCAFGGHNCSKDSDNNKERRLVPQRSLGRDIRKPLRDLLATAQEAKKNSQPLSGIKIRYDRYTRHE